MKFLILTSILFSLASCQYGNSVGVKKPYAKLVEFLESRHENQKTQGNSFRLEKAKELKSLSETTIQDINSVEPFTRKYYAFETKENTLARLEAMEERVIGGQELCTDGTLELQKIIHTIGEQNYRSGEKAVENEILTLYALQYVKRVYETCSLMLFHYMNELSIEKYDSLPSVLELRSTLLSQFFGTIGILKVISNDSQTISNNLVTLRENDQLDSESLELIELLAINMKNSRQELQKFTDRLYSQDIPKELQGQYQQTLEKADELFAGKTLLFDPALPDHPVTNLMVVFSNLTWGSIQSTLGLGLVLIHKVVITPSSWILSKFFPRRFSSLSLRKSLAISANRMQIYADLCGFPRIFGKMSMGIWELDFCLGHTLSSGHEGGHSKQSALLGPLYLPAALLSYISVGGHGGFIETWAERWTVRN